MSDVQVWFCNGVLHLIPLSHTSSPPSNLADELDPDAYLDPLEAIALVRDPLIPTASPKQVQEAIWNRISGSVVPPHLS